MELALEVYEAFALPVQSGVARLTWCGEAEMKLARRILRRMQERLERGRRDSMVDGNIRALLPSMNER